MSIQTTQLPSCNRFVNRLSFILISQS